ncbi:MAG: hypothetical protein ABIQ73_10170 [Acidimicrobiales bacterium]
MVAMLALFVVGLMVTKAWLPGPVQVRQQCRQAFEHPAIETDTAAMVADASVCTPVEFIEAAHDALDMNFTEAEEFRRKMCAMTRTGNTSLAPCATSE